MNPAHRIGSRATQQLPVAAVLILWALMMSVASGAAAAAGALNSAIWRTHYWGRNLQGVACWILGPSGEARLEVAALDSLSASSADDLHRLLVRQGEGTTIVTPDEQTMLLQQWGGKWREVKPPLTAELQVLARAAMADQVPRDLNWSPWARPLPESNRQPARLRWQREREGNGARLRLEVGGQAPGSPVGLRRALVSRGHGRGGPGEIWRLSWRSRGGDAVLEVQSSRWPGGLEIWDARAISVDYPEYETFLPLWNLGDLLVIEGAELP
jgi:hypothetical protein